MATELAEKLYQRFTLESRLYQLGLQLQELEEEIPRRKYRVRLAGVALTEYEGMGLRSFLDKLSGKFGEKQENLQRALRSAQAELEAGTVEQNRLKQQQAGLLQQLEPLRELGDVLSCAASLPEAEKTQVLQLEARLCTQRLAHALEETYKALEIAQEWVRPNNRVDTAPGHTKGILMSAADRWARDCMEEMSRIAQCGILLDIHPYFTNPTGYISGVTQFNQLDRLNRALSAVSQAQGQAQELLLQLPQWEEWE